MICEKRKTKQNKYCTIHEVLTDDVHRCLLWRYCHCSALNVCVCMCGRFSNTFPRSRKHDGTASEQGGQTLLTVSTARQKISGFWRERRSGFQRIHLEKQNKNWRGIHMDSNVMSDHKGVFTAWLFWMCFTSIQENLLRQRRMHHATSKENCKFLGGIKYFLTELFLWPQGGQFNLLVFPETIHRTSSYRLCDMYHMQWQWPQYFMYTGGVKTCLTYNNPCKTFSCMTIKIKPLFRIKKMFLVQHF